MLELRGARMHGRHRLFFLPLVFLLFACAPATGVVRLETAHREPVVHSPPSNSEMVEVGQREFLEAVSQLAYGRLPLDLVTAFGETLPRVRLSPKVGWDQRDNMSGRPRGPWAHLLLVGFSGNRGDRNPESWPDRVTLIGAAKNLSEDERFDMAMSFAFDSVWEGVAQAVKAEVDPVRLRLAISSALGAYMLLLLAPEPVTKFIAIALSAYLVAYIGCVPLWNMVEAYKRLRQDAMQANTLHDLQEAGHRFGTVAGDNGTRVLILVAMASAGGQAGMATRGPMLPGYSRAAITSEANLGIRLGAIAEGGIQSISVRPGMIVVGAAPSAVASTGWGTGGESDPTSAPDVSEAQITKRPLKEFDIDRYGRFSTEERIGDGLEGHEMLQNAWLKEHGYARLRGSGAASTNNPAVAVRRALHDRIGEEQRALGLYERSRLGSMTAEQNIELNALAMRRAGVPEPVIQTLMKEALAHAASLAR